MQGNDALEHSDIAILFKQVKDLYNMHNNPAMDKRINGLLSVLNQVVAALGEMRNKDGDAHGRGTKRIPVKISVQTFSTITLFHKAIISNSAN